MARLDPVVLLSAGFLLLLAGLTWAGTLPVAALILYLVASTATFIAYAADKSAARDQRWRIRESTLHLLALAGGWPGAWAAQRMLRHKNGKLSFQATFWLTVALNGGALFWLFPPLKLPG